MKKDPFETVYKRMKDRIEADTQGVEYTKGEAEIIYNNQTYWIDYTLTREFNEVFRDYDSEPDDRSRTNLSINDFMVYDQDG